MVDGEIYRKNEACSSSTIKQHPRSNNDGTHYATKRCDKCNYAFWEGSAACYDNSPTDITRGEGCEQENGQKYTCEICGYQWEYWP